MGAVCDQKHFVCRDQPHLHIECRDQVDEAEQLGLTGGTWEDVGKRGRRAVWSQQVTAPAQC
jgi:hypothetical protein